MPDRECKKRWDRENVKFITTKLFLTKESDKEIADYLKRQESASATVKAALREYMENHKDD